MGTIASQITSLTIVYSTVYSDADQRKTKLRVTGLCAGIHRGTVNSPHKWPVTLKMFPFDDVIMCKQRPITCQVTKLTSKDAKTMVLGDVALILNV